MKCTTSLLTGNEVFISTDRSTLDRLDLHSDSLSLSLPCSLLPTEGPHKDVLQH